MFLSVIIPAYNEEKRILVTLFDIYTYFKDKNFLFEIIIVDDGSTDNTYSLVNKFLSNHFKRYKIIKNSHNRGKGYSVKEGMLRARGDYVLFMDADNSTNIKELDVFLPYFKKYNVMIASRAFNGERVKIKRRFLRFLFSKFSNIVIQVLAVPGVKDTQCGFKIFSKLACRKVFERQTIFGWGFDFEILSIAKHLGYEIKEIPVNWVHVGGGNVKVSRALLTLFELFRVKWNLIGKKYYK